MSRQALPSLQGRGRGRGFSPLPHAPEGQHHIAQGSALGMQAQEEPAP